MDSETLEPESLPALRLLQDGESVQTFAETESATVLVTDRRLVVFDDNRIILEVAYDTLRRVEFDIERRRSATLVIVPDRAGQQPQVLPVPPERYPEIARALALVGARLDEA